MHRTVEDKKEALRDLIEELLLEIDGSELAQVVDSAFQDHVCGSATALYDAEYDVLRDVFSDKWIDEPDAEASEFEREAVYDFNYTLNRVRENIDSLESYSENIHEHKLKREGNSF